MYLILPDTVTLHKRAFDLHRLILIFIACHRFLSLVIALSLEAQRTIRVAA
jgi:hypothetical protein